MRKPLRFANFLAPSMMPVYAAIAQYISRRLNIPTEISNGSTYGQVRTHYEVCFLCGLAYIELADDAESGIVPIAAPVLQGDRFDGKPIYYSDVIVRRDRPWRRFADLRGCSWAYNEPFSQSGYGITRYCLARLGEGRGFFGATIEAGFHDRSIQMVAFGKIDASAIDCHTLAIAFRDRPELVSKLRIIDQLGPSTIQPVTVSAKLPRSLQDDLQTCFVEMTGDPAMKQRFHRAMIDRFVPVDDSSYDDLRAMKQNAAANGVFAL